MNYDLSLKKVEKLYDHRILSTKDAVKAAGQWGSDEYVPLICEEICSKIDLKKTNTVLELGCGSGVLGNWIAKRCRQYVGTDLSYMMLQFFSKNSKENLSLIQGTADLTPLPDNRFDIVILNGVTMHFPNKELLESTLKETKRLVTKPGIIFIGENVIPSGFFWEFAWFNKLSKNLQRLLLPYMKTRKWLAKNPKLAGKWKSTHNEISPKFIKEFFSDHEVKQSKASAYTVKQRILESKYKGNRRADFLIKL